MLLAREDYEGGSERLLILARESKKALQLTAISVIV